jgi:hypothetical protein
MLDEVEQGSGLHAQFQTLAGASVAAKADRVLELFRTNDVTSTAGHRRILESWAQLEGLDPFVGASVYRRHRTGYVLPWP